MLIKPDTWLFPNEQMIVMYIGTAAVKAENITALIDRLKLLRQSLGKNSLSKIEILKVAYVETKSITKAAIKAEMPIQTAWKILVLSGLHIPKNRK